jgi:hypothetical protein
VKKSCGVWAIVFFGCVLLVGFLAGRRIIIAAAPGGIIGGAMLWLGLAYIGGIRDKLRIARLIRRAQNGEPPRDGEVIAAVGRITPLDELLVSPFRGETCVAYRYRVRTPHNKTTTTDYEGIALVPAMIGSTKLLAWPELDVPETLCTTEAERRNALAYAEHTQFTVAQMFKPDNTRAPRVRYDHRRHATTDAMRSSLLYEIVLRPDEEVCALGYYSANEGGLTHEPDTLVPSLKIMNGSPAAIRTRLVRRSFGNILGGLFCIALAAAGLIALYANVPIAAAEQMSPDRTTWWWELRLQRLIDRQWPPDETIPTNLERGLARGRIVAGDREVHPTTATGIDDTITIGNNDAVATIDGNRLTHLELLGKSVEGAELEVLNVDVRFIEGRITYLGDDAKCRIAFKAALGSHLDN